MDFENIVFKARDKIATITLNSPKNFNAISEELLMDLGSVLDLCTDDESVRVIVIRGEGRVFCSGPDIRSLKKGLDEKDTQKLVRIVRAAGNIGRKIRSIRKPVIASLHGAVAATGCGIALLCDFKVAADDVLFIEAFLNIGLIPDMGYTYTLGRYVGLGHLTEFLMLSKLLTVDKAYEMGLVNVVTTKENLESETTALAKKLVALPYDAVALTKALINQTIFQGLDQCLDREIKYQDLLSRSENYAEGVDAFLEKRPAVFNKQDLPNSGGGAS
ncbi:MAG: enoyl-CoA hydratase/isomerase family protein [Synergistaceae bacterium]|jgi:enoyl-CoA hydratase/carnithine racemase|nr:enoyl-CoA hydratase/isomerase family protein [Synergistaceae bacterium]